MCRHKTARKIALFPFHETSLKLKDKIDRKRFGQKNVEFVIALFRRLFSIHHPYPHPAQARLKSDRRAERRAPDAMAAPRQRADDRAHRNSRRAEYQHEKGEAERVGQDGDVGHGWLLHHFPRLRPPARTR